jgi:hypothetical protein
MAPLKVLFVQNRLCSRTWKQAGALTAAGHQVSIFELSQPSRFRDYSAFEEHVTVDVPPDLRSILRHQRRIRAALKTLLAERDYDLVHSANAPDAFGAWLPAMTDVPIIHDIHDIQTAMPTKWSNPVYNRVVDILKRQWERHVCLNAAGILTPSSFMADHFKTKYGIENVWSLANKPFPVAIDSRPKLRERDGEVHLVYAGGITLEEGTDRRLIPPFLRLAELGYHVHVYGVLADADRPVIEAALARHPRVHLEPVVPQESFIEEMSQYDAGLIWFTNLHDNIRSASPNKLYEFQIAQIPVVTNVQEGALPEEVHKRDCGYIVESPEAFHEVFDPEKRFRFSPKDCFLDPQELESIYSQVQGKVVHIDQLG